jgi:polyphosphate glucokinase
MKALGIDIGGSALKGAPVDLNSGKLLAERFRIETPEAVTPAQMAKHIREMAAHFRWHGPIGVGYPGVIVNNHTMTAANMHKSWVGCDAGNLLGRATGCRVELINDADAAGLAEMRFGAGRKFEGSVLLLTLGTGIGTALFFRGQLFPNTELGHLPWKGRSAEKFAAASVRKKKDLSWEEWAGRVDKYLAKMEALFWPELIIIGGGVSTKHTQFFKYLKTRARLVPARLFNNAGIVGAAVATQAH